MDLSKDETAKFKKLGINSLLELSLLIPHSYEDYRLHETLLPQKAQLIDATVESVYKAPNSIQITFFAHNLGHSVQGVLFRPKPYMLHQFKVGERDYYYGVIDCKQGHCSMSMPKKITQVGKITPKYKTALRSDVMQRLVSVLLTKENLLEAKIKEEVAEELLQVHFPSDAFLQGKDMSEKTLRALKYTELFVYMQMLAGKRRYFKALSSQAGDYKPWSKTLPFTLTSEQIKAIEEIRQDLQKGVAAKRMVVGDVGSGKTMVILAAAYMNMPNRSVLMAPTTILANQLFEEAQKYLPDLKTVLVTNKSKKLDLSEYDFIIGTHALLFRQLPEASLVMVDEQHRFGTKQRNMLEKLVSQQEQKPHYIQFSATPIPRTQAMIESAHIDVSLITTTPFTKDIDSQVIHKEDFKELLLHVKGEIAKNNQVLIVYPLVEQSEVLEYQSIDEARGYWERNFDNVYVTHGKDKENKFMVFFS